MKTPEILRILESLASGDDPFTGEHLPNQSPYHDPRVIRALYMAVRELERGMLQRRVVDGAPPMAGTPWTDAEDHQLIEEFDAAMPFAVIARKHERTAGAIRSRLQRLGKLDTTIPTGKSTDHSETTAKSEKWWIEAGRTQAGKTWTREEDEALLQEFDAGMDIEQIAQRRKRGVKSVEVRLVKLGRTNP